MKFVWARLQQTLNKLTIDNLALNNQRQECKQMDNGGCWW